MICTTCATLNIMCMYYLRLLPSFSHLIRFRGNSPAFQRKIRVRRPRRARKNRSCFPWKTPSSPETSHSRYTTLVDNPFRSDPSRGQVDFCFLGLLARHSDFPGYERSGMLIRLYNIFQQAVPLVSDLRLMCHLLNNCSLYMSIILIYLLSINIGNN